MADEPLIPAPGSPPPPLNKLVEELVEQSFDPQKLSRWERLIGNALQWALTNVIGVVLSLGAKIGVLFASSLADAENNNQAAFNELARVAIKDMFNVDAPALTNARGTGGNKAAADAIGAALITAFSGQAGGASIGENGLEPSDAPAKAFLSAMSQLALEGWLEGWLAEAMTLGQLETFGDLDDSISHVLGLGRASAAVHGPLVRHLITTPLDWKVSKEHRPQLLGPSQVARQWARGKWDWEDVLEELARQGWSDERIDAIINEQRRFISLEDVDAIAHRIGATNFDAKQYLQDMGYEKRDADLVIQARDARRLDAQERQLADAYVSALVAGDIAVQRFVDGINAIKLPAGDTEHYLRLGQLRRDLAGTPLSDGDAQAAVKLKIQSFAWYREQLARRGLDDDAIITKELLLRAEISRDTDAATLRAQQAADRAAAAAASNTERAARVAAKAIADALPAYGEIRRAFIRGLVPLERLALAIAATHPGIDGADAAALAADAQLDRETFLEHEAAHAAALAADKDPALPLATLEQSVMRGITSLDAYDRELVRRQYSDESRAILIALLRDKLADAAAAVAAKAAAEKRAQLHGVSLPDFVRAVRLGLRTPAELETFLRQLETPDVERALILDLVESDRARDADARAARDAADAAAAARSINLPLRRRAVVKGLRSIEEYAQDLQAAGVDGDNRELELGLVALEVDAAAAARARAGQIEGESGAVDGAVDRPTLTLAQTERAVKLGILTPDDLRAQLVARGYGADDVETLVATVVADVPELRAAQRLNTAVAGDVKTKGLDLPALERAVARGLRTLADYRAELAARGYGADDLALLVTLLSEKVAIDLDGLRKKVTTAIATVDGAPTVDELELAAVDGSVDVATLQRFLISVGVARDVAVVYLRLVRTFAAAGGNGGAA